MAGVALGANTGKDTGTTKKLNNGEVMKTPRTFRNELYEFLVSRDVTEETARAIAAEAELYAEAYEAYKLRDITFAAQSMGLDVNKITRKEGEE